MGETTVNAAYMYDEVEEIRNLNKVEGFDPRRYMRIIGQESIISTWRSVSSGSG
ncbi:hypothetical protein AALB47_17175 [Lachnospiraceae bacterium 54-11]